MMVDLLMKGNNPSRQMFRADAIIFDYLSTMA